MNYEEMLRVQEEMSPRRELLPFGGYLRRQTGGKYRYVVVLRPELIDNLVFCESLKAEQQWSLRQQSKFQLHYELRCDDGGQLFEVAIEPGTFQPLSALLRDNPAVVAQRGFVDQVVGALFEYASQLHSQLIFCLCFAPQNVFVRKGDNTPLVFFNGSFYKNVSDKASLFSGAEEFVAPEVLAGQPYDQRSDVYSLGRLISFLFSQGDIPYEYRNVVKKATAENPEERYKSVEDMRDAVSRKRHTRRSAIYLAIAVVISLLSVFLYIDTFNNNTAGIEFVEPVQQTYDDPFISSELDDTTLVADSLDITDEALIRKAEMIYRKRYQAAADEILSRVYNNQHMGTAEKAFMANTQSMAEDLLKAQQKLAEEAGIPESVAGRIGHEIVEKLTQEKQQSLTRNGYIKTDDVEKEE